MSILKQPKQWHHFQHIEDRIEHKRVYEKFYQKKSHTWFEECLDKELERRRIYNLNIYIK